MKHFLIAIIIFSISIVSKAQDSFDIGFFGGTSFYMGDVNKKFFYSPSTAAGGVARLNLTNRYAVRANLTQVRFHGSDLDFSNEYQKTRMHSFKTAVVDANVQLEFYFLDYSPYDDGYNFTPYISTGIGGGFFSTSNNLSGYFLNIPFSAGFRYRVAKYISAGAQWELKKTFNDLLDGLDQNNFDGASLFAGKQKSYFSDNDWYSYIGIFVTVTLYKPTGKCNAYGKSYKYR
jgi:hypothetical protein